MHIHDEINNGLMQERNDTHENNVVAVMLLTELEAVDILKRNTVSSIGTGCLCLKDEMLISLNVVKNTS